MNTRRIFASMGVVLLFAAGGLIAAENEAGDDKFKATCPVSGKPAIEASVVELPKGEGKVYFCCKNCPKAYKNNPEKFEMKVRRQLLETGQVAQVGCPFSGRPVNEETMVDVGEAKVGFCCKNCLAKFNEADEEGKLQMVFANFDKGFTRQTKCPVSGQPIKAEHMVEHDGKKVYFCCPNCPAAFEADPQKFIRGDGKAPLPQFREGANGSGEA
jgi:YHS domain-containing protein